MAPAATIVDPDGNMFIIESFKCKVCGKSCQSYLELVARAKNGAPLNSMARSNPQTLGAGPRFNSIRVKIKTS
jgi:hypothetical protein